MEYVVGIFGGAVAGSEAAWHLAQRGIRSIVFEQFALPYGKIENGLPKWHIKLRDKQEEKINEKLNHPLISYMPLFRLGREALFEEIRHEWNLSAILLATGAWADRQLDLPGLSQPGEDQLIYQNALVQYFNQKHDPKYSGPRFEIKDGAAIIGGGLASIDTAKIIMIELVEAALLRKGIKTDAISIERQGVDGILAQYNLTLQELGLQGATLFFRRRKVDMALSPELVNPTTEEIEKNEKLRLRILENVQSKFLFKVEELRSPARVIMENNSLAGVIFTPNTIVNSKALPSGEPEKIFYTRQIISAIGSEPEPIAGLPFENGKFRVVDKETGELAGCDRVFVLGNAVTGRGNIRESQMHGKQVAGKVSESLLALKSSDYESIFDASNEIADQQVNRIFTKLSNSVPLNEVQTEVLSEKVRRHHQKIGYSGYESWIKLHLPQRLEQMLGLNGE